MQPHSSTNWSVIVALVGAAVVFGVVGYYIGTLKNASIPSGATTQTVASNVTTTATPAVSPTTTATTVTATSTATPDPTAGWKTYTSTKYGFAFKYPNDWQLDTSCVNDSVCIDSPSTARAIASRNTLGSDIYFEYYPSLTDLTKSSSSTAATLHDYLSDTNASLVSNLSATTLNSYPAYTGSLGGLSEYYVIYIEHNGHIYNIRFGQKVKASQLTPTEQDILSAFRFTN